MVLRCYCRAYLAVEFKKRQLQKQLQQGPALNERFQAVNGLCCNLVAKLDCNFDIFLAMVFPNVDRRLKEGFKYYVIKNVVFWVWSNRLMNGDKVSPITMRDFCRLKKRECMLIAEISYDKIQSWNPNVHSFCSKEEIYCALKWIQNVHYSKFANANSMSELKWVLSQDAYQRLTSSID